MAHILVVEDNTTMREGIVQILSSMGHEVHGAPSGKEGLQYFHLAEPEFVITDLKMDDIDGMKVLKEIRETSPETIVMIITAFGTIEVAVEAMKLGAYDFITKPFPPDLLRVKVAKGLELVRAKAENTYFRQEQNRKLSDSIIGDSTSMKEIKEQTAKASSVDSTVLITGESGTGKEVIARAIHTQSNRKDKPFIKVDCAALAEGILESELFGHERGAFTGASNRKQGRFELADKGTLFLDEIGNLSPQIQLKLLRVLQDRSFERVGGTKTLHVDVRIISATNADLKKQVKEGTFREDLYYRLHIIPIALPPLRKRKTDIPVLIEHFTRKFSNKMGRHYTFTKDAMEMLESYEWPGNIRELMNVLERIFVLAKQDEIGTDDLPSEIGKSNEISNLPNESKDLSLEEALEAIEKSLILKAFNECGGVKTRTAEKLGIKTSALYYKLEKYGIS
ncbi:MAG: sigma-54-dependent Fis family transcriptional regulator [Proteobacteria bacterium]|jgi:two-component system response regulator HydG|nr:sigma-54-dependent Fis family transcriptional regulator [Pseudomonadota bacterium]